MSTVLKFRAWDRKEKHFVYFELHQGANNHTPPIYDWADLEPWQQFIRLLDPEEKEVYEGDIIEYSYTQPRRGYGAHPPTAETWGKKNNLKKVIEWKHMSNYTGFSIGSVDGKIKHKVIGNVFENPDLIV